jgi:hypothetical protein
MVGYIGILSKGARLWSAAAWRRFVTARSAAGLRQRFRTLRALKKRRQVAALQEAFYCNLPKST